MTTLLKRLIVSRRIHLCLGVFLLYGLSWAITRTTVEEKILDSLQKYCLSQYWLRESLFEEERIEAEFYHERYREQLESLTAGLFDYRDKNQVQMFFLPRGFLYEVWEEGRGNHSYLLTEIVSQRRYHVDAPERFSFDYLSLEKRGLNHILNSNTVEMQKGWYRQGIKKFTSTRTDSVRYSGGILTLSGRRSLKNQKVIIWNGKE